MATIPVCSECATRASRGVVARLYPGWECLGTQGLKVPAGIKGKFCRLLDNLNSRVLPVLLEQGLRCPEPLQMERIGNPNEPGKTSDRVACLDGGGDREPVVRQNHGKRDRARNRRRKSVGVGAGQI